MTTRYYQSAIEYAKRDARFASILVAPNPFAALQKLQDEEWLNLTRTFSTQGWIKAAMDARNHSYKSPDSYSSDSCEIAEILKVQDFYRSFQEYASVLSSSGEKPFSDYLNGITIEEFRNLMKDLTGMDSAREIQRLYKDGIIDYDLGGSQLHRYMERLALPYVPTINHLNSAKRGEVSRGRNKKA